MREHLMGLFEVEDPEVKSLPLLEGHYGYCTVKSNWDLFVVVERGEEKDGEDTGEGEGEEEGVQGQVEFKKGAHAEWVQGGDGSGFSSGCGSSPVCCLKCY
eukprot:TRINITY_DN16743_c0_g1_i1.p2 TRINITY_DN16743_c0_g1~~TRINITY_DN16743_c0_g1_i1.p2  ORF type:complete len:101 (-),score=34.02 TRINITY_DN16743_c0_g1_i1:99-401(-)